MYRTELTYFVVLKKNFCMIKKINIATVLILLASINIAFSQFQVPTNYLPGSNMNQTPVVNKATGSNKVTKREIVNSAKQKRSY
jgi:hypothetical protein